MKHKNILNNIRIALGIMLLSLSSCEHKPLETDGYTGLRITVTDAGYINADNGSRATETDFTTTFEEGDKIGIFVVDNEGKVLRSNVPFICAGNDLWYTPENSIRVKEFPVKIVAYYPYVEDTELEGKITPTAETASEFFATYISGLDITDQSTEELYRKADVMACMKSFNTKEEWFGTLDLSLEHLMGLVIVNLPKTVTANKTNYYLSWDPTVTWVGYAKDKAQANAEIDLETITGIYPFKNQVEKTYSYRYIVKPASALPEINGEFQCFGIKKNYNIESGKTVSQGKYKEFNINATGGYDVVAGKVVYTPKIGDYYLINGVIMDGDYDLTEAEKALCMGIVYYTGSGINANGKTHGLIVGLNQVYTKWGKSGEKSGVSTSETLFNGLNNTNYLLKYRSAYAIVSGYNSLKSMEAVAQSGKTSGWYIPSVAELKPLYAVFDKVNEKILKVDGGVGLIRTVYWSSSELNEDRAYNMHLNDGIVGNYIKTYERYMCLVSAF